MILSLITMYIKQKNLLIVTDYGKLSPRYFTLFLKDWRIIERE